MAAASLDSAVSNATGPGAELSLVVPGLGPTRVGLRRWWEGGVAEYHWQHPTTGEWHEVPDPSLGEFERLFAPVAGEASSPHFLAVANALFVHENHRDGVLVSFDHPNEAEQIGSSNSGAAGMADAFDDAGWTDRWLADGTDRS